MKLSSPLDLIKKSWDIFFDKNNFLYFLKIYFWLVPFALYSYYQSFYINSLSIPGSGSEQILSALSMLFKSWIIIPAIIINLLHLVVIFWVYTTGMYAVKNVIDGKDNPKVKELFRFSSKKLWKFSLVGILTTLIIICGFLFFVIPGLVFSVWFYFSNYAFIDKNLSPIKSLTYSKSLVKNRFWAVTGRIIVFMLFTSLTNLLVSMIPYLNGIILSLLGPLFYLPFFLLYKELAFTTSVDSL